SARRARRHFRHRTRRLHRARACSGASGRAGLLRGAGTARLSHAQAAAGGKEESQRLNETAVPKRKAAKPLRGETLLIELLTEELPPRSLARLADAFGDAVFDGLKAQYFLSERSRVETFATPRRLAARVSDVLAVQPDRIIERKGPAVASAIDTAGKPTPALLGFARSCGVDPGKLERHKDDRASISSIAPSKRASRSRGIYPCWSKPRSRNFRSRSSCAGARARSSSCARCTARSCCTVRKSSPAPFSG